MNYFEVIDIGTFNVAGKVKTNDKHSNIVQDVSLNK